jgi:Flp pilus assembly CpaF family ATPase
MTQLLGQEVDTISVDYLLVGDIVDKVNDLIDQDAQQRGRRLGRTDERQLAMARTMDVIVREGAARARQGLDMWSEVQENAIRDAVMDAMFGLGRIQKWLKNPNVEDLYIAGTRPAHARLSDGSIVECGVVADTNEELIEQLRIIATHGSSTERQMVSARPIIDMRLPDGQRAAGIWEVVPEPHLTIRCHRYVDITLEKLIGMGMVSRSMANFLYAAVRGRRSILVIGVPGAGKLPYFAPSPSASTGTKDSPL